MGEFDSLNENSKLKTKVVADSLFLFVFVFLFSFIYIGTVLKVILPEEIQNTRLTSIMFSTNNTLVLVDKQEYKELPGTVAGIATESGTINQNDQGILVLILKIPQHFFNNLLASLTF